MNDSCSISLLLLPCARLKVVNDRTWRSTYCSVGAATSQKPTEPDNNHGLPADNRARSGRLEGNPGVPARRRVGSTGRSRSPTFPFLGGPTRGCSAVKSGQAWAQETGNGLSWDRQRRTRKRGFPGGARAPEAHVGNGMTSALGHLSPAL